MARYLLGSFSRVTSRGRTYIPQLDGLRFVAIVWVVAFHLGGFLLCKTGHERLWWHSWNPLIFWAYSGNIGVNLFFGISGFILAMPFAKYYVAGGKPVSLKAYFTRRLTRLEPPYLVHLTVLFLTGGVLGQYLVTSAMPAGYNFLAEATRHLLTSLVYCNWLIYPNTHPYLNGVLWSLEVEVQFYILVPLLTTVFAIRNRSYRRLAIMLGMVAFAVLSPYVRQTRFSMCLVPCLQEFLAGFLLVDFYLAQEEGAAGRSCRWDLLSLAAWTGILFWTCLGWGWILGSPWLIFLAYLGAFRGTILPRVLSNPWLTTIGGMCYTIYMYHVLIISAAGRYSTRLSTGILWLDMLFQAIILSGAVLLVSAVLFRLFERPFMQPNWHKQVLAYIRRLRSRQTENDFSSCPGELEPETPASGE